MTHYVIRGGAQTYAQPYDCENTRLFTFLLEADPVALRALCDKCLNGPSGGNVRYHPLAPFVFLAAAEIERVHVGMTDGRQFFTPEIDVAFWVPLVALKTVGGVEIAERFVWFLPYLFVDSTWAVASGREIYGFPKETATFQQEMDGPDAAAGNVNLKSLIVQTAVVARFGPDAPVQTQPVVTLQRTAGGGGLTKLWGSIEEAGKDIFGMLTASGSLVLPGLELVVELANLLIHGRYPMVFLKQFPSVADGRLACYQAVIEAPITISHFHIGGPMAGTYTVNIGQFESHPIVQELGLKGSTIQALAGWHLAFNFQMENGSVLWAASAGS